MFTSWCLASSLDVVSDLQKFLVLQCHVLAVFVRDEKIERYDLKIFLFITSLKHFDYYMPSVFLNLNTIDVFGRIIHCCTAVLCIVGCLAILPASALSLM